MLSAFVARPVVDLKARDKSKIESILAHGDRLLVGLNTGSLRIYRVNEIDEDSHSSDAGNCPNADDSAPPAPKPVDLLRDLDKFSTKSIEQLAIIKEASILISLSNSVVSIHDLHAYTLNQVLSKTKGASTFAVTSNIVKDSATGIPEIISRLAVSVKRRVLFWSWHESEVSDNVVEITLQSSIRSLTWASATKIVCGMNSGYVIVDVNTRQVEDIVGPGAIGGAHEAGGGSRFGGVGSASMGYMGLGGYMPKPLSTRLGEGQMLLAKDINSLFIDNDGKPLEKRQVPWSGAPEGIGYSYPYMIALQAKGVLEIRNTDTQSLLQSVSLPSATHLHFPPPTVSLSHAGKGFHVISEKSIWKMCATNYDLQVDQLVNAERYDEAISVLDMLEDALLKNKEGRLREIKMQKAQYLFDERNYRQSLDLFTEVEAPPERVIRLYPRDVTGDLTTMTHHDDSTDTADSPSVHSKDPCLEDGSDTMETMEPKPADLVSGKPVPASMSKLGVKSAKESRSFDHGSVKDNGDAASFRGSIRGKPTVHEGRALQGKDLTNAVIELISFLVGTRTRLQRFIDPATGKLRPSSVAGPNTSSAQALESLLFDPTTVENIDLEEKLVETARLVDTTLFRSYMLARPTLAASLFRLPNFCDPEVVGEKLVDSKRYQDLIDFYHGKKLHRQALELLQKFGQQSNETDEATSLAGPKRTVGYLQALPPDMIDLILEFSKWPLEVDRDLGMEVFLADTENAETLPRESVLNFLEEIDYDLEERYLEHIINELGDGTATFHNKLVGAYILELKGREDRTSSSWHSKMQRLLNILRGSKQYSASRAFGLIPREDPGFYEAQAIVLSNIGNHKQALEVYVFKLRDFEKVEEYCNQVHLKDDLSSEGPVVAARHTSVQDPEEDAPTSIYHILLSLYLQPPPPHETNWPPALDLLARHGSRLPASSTLNLIPSTLPIRQLASYFTGRIRSANSIVNESRITSNLLKSAVVSAQAALLLGEDPVAQNAASNRNKGRNRRVCVEEDRVCGVCHKRLMRSVIAVLPDNTVVHYGCLNRGVGGIGSGLSRRESGSPAGTTRISGFRRGSSWGNGNAV